MREEMESVLLKMGYTKSSEPNEYVKGNWTVRFDAEYVEAFNNPDIEAGRHFIGPINKVDLEQLLTEIDDFIMQ